MEPSAMLEPIVDRMQSKANVKTVFGEPFEAHGRTFVPVATVAYGFGGGAGSGKHSTDRREIEDGGGLGGGVRAKAAGVLEISAQGTRFVRFGPNWGLIGAVSMALFLVMRTAKKHPNQRRSA